MVLPGFWAASQPEDGFLELLHYVVLGAVELCWWKLNGSSVAALACRKAVEMSPVLTVWLKVSASVNSRRRTQKIGADA